MSSSSSPITCSAIPSTSLCVSGKASGLSNALDHEAIGSSSTVGGPTDPAGLTWSLAKRRNASRNRTTASRSLSNRCEGRTVFIVPWAPGNIRETFGDVLAAGRCDGEVCAHFDPEVSVSCVSCCDGATRRTTSSSGPHHGSIGPNRRRTRVLDAGCATGGLYLSDAVARSRAVSNVSVSNDPSCRAPLM
jgi:hypothetical protein